MHYIEFKFENLKKFFLLLYFVYYIIKILLLLDLIFQLYFLNLVFQKLQNINENIIINSQKNVFELFFILLAGVLLN